MAPEDVAAVVTTVAPYTMTDETRIAGLIEEVEHILRANIPGDFVECGVWKGGSMMAVALTLLRMGVVDRELWMFDTYTGMPTPGVEDIDCFGRVALDPKSEAFNPKGCRIGMPAVKRAMELTGYPAECVHYIAGMVEETIPKHAPNHIALLHLDTDWYQSTRHELEYLFPRVSEDGCIMVDDYGHWQGARKATDEYLAKNAPGLSIRPCGYTAVILHKNI